MRIIALVVLLALVSGAVWVLNPGLVEKLGSGLRPDDESAPAPATSSAPTGSEVITVAPRRDEAKRNTDRAQPLVAPAAETIAVEREARRYVRRLTQTEPAPVPAERADHFVSGDQVLKLVALCEFAKRLDAGPQRARTFSGD